MIDDFMYVLENYPDANLRSEAARRNIAESLIRYMCEHHIVMYTNLDAVREDPAMLKFIENFDCETHHKDLPVEKGL